MHKSTIATAVTYEGVDNLRICLPALVQTHPTTGVASSKTKGCLTGWRDFKIGILRYFHFGADDLFW